MADNETFEEVEPNFEAFAVHPEIKDLPKEQQHAEYRRAWARMIDAKNAGRDKSYSDHYWTRSIRGRGVKGHGKNYGDMPMSSDPVTT